MDTGKAHASGAPVESSGSDFDGASSSKIIVTLKLYASLGHYLPDGAERNQADVSVKPGTTARALLDAYSVPPESCHLVLVNGIYQSPEARAVTPLVSGDNLAVWPPVAGG